MVRRGSDTEPDYAHVLPYNPALDGIRAVAISGVLLAHFGVPPFRGGGQGVDVFFVLSGYLITSVILGDEKFHLGRFYWRRLVRLAPALVVLCACYYIVGFFALNLPQVVGDIVTSVTYISNWTRAFGSPYPQYLGQTWSLSVEEQFYLFAPAILLLAGRTASGKGSTALLGCAAIGCILYRTMLFQQGTPFERIYNGLDTHCDGLLLGVMLGKIENDGVLLSCRRRVAFSGSVALGVILVMFCVTEWGVTTSVLVDGAALWLIVSVTADRGSATAKVLSLAPLVWLGQISYSLYLWHYPIFLFLYYNLRASHAVQIGIGIPSSIAMAVLSHRLVEKPALTLRDRPTRSNQRRLGLVSAFATYALLAAGCATYLRDDLTDLFVPPPLRVEAYGPQASVKGQGFNVQPDDGSVIWAKTSARLPRDATANWHGQDLKMSLSNRGFIVFAPPTLLDSVGHNVITIRSEGSEIASLDIAITE